MFWLIELGKHRPSTGPLLVIHHHDMDGTTHEPAMPNAATPHLFAYIISYIYICILYWVLYPFKTTSDFQSYSTRKVFSWVSRHICSLVRCIGSSMLLDPARRDACFPRWMTFHTISRKKTHHVMSIWRSPQKDSEYRICIRDRNWIVIYLRFHKQIHEDINVRNPKVHLSSFMDHPSQLHMVQRCDGQFQPT